MKTLSGQVALVSGAGRGIGRAIALKLASAGARLVVNDLDQEEAEAVRKEIEGLGGQAVVCDGDVTAADFGERFVRVAIDNYAGLDIIINNAGYTWDSVIQNMSDEQWYAIIDCHRSEEHTSELQSLMRISYAVFCLKKKKIITNTTTDNNYNLT